MNQKSVTMIFPDDGIGARVYPQRMSYFLNSYYQSKGAQILSRESIAAIEKSDSWYLCRTTGGKNLRVEGVVAGIGIQPNTELAQSAGLAVDNGVVVDEFLQTSHSDIYAAGDVANFYSPVLG